MPIFEQAKRASGHYVVVPRPQKQATARAAQSFLACFGDQGQTADTSNRDAQGRNWVRTGCFGAKLCCEHLGDAPMKRKKIAVRPETV